MAPDGGGVMVDTCDSPDELVRELSLVLFIVGVNVATGQLVSSREA